MMLSVTITSKQIEKEKKAGGNILKKCNRIDSDGTREVAY